MPDREPDLKLIANLRALIAQDPEGYVERRMPYIAWKVLADLRSQRADLTGGSEDAKLRELQSGGTSDD